MLSDLFHHPDDDHELGEDHSKDTNDPKIPYTVNYPTLQEIFLKN